MTRNRLFPLVLFFAFSCIDDQEKSSLRQEEGRVWLSGGLASCAEQIHLDNGDTLIVGDIEEILSFTSAERVQVKYKELGRNQFCSNGIDCEILEIEKID